MAITLNALTPAKFGFSANGYSADMSTCEEIIPTPGTGKRLCLTHLTLNVAANLTITIGSGESGPGSVEAALLGPLYMLAGATLLWNFHNGGVVLPENKSLTIDSSGAGGVTVFAEGHTI
jgi:hypothetical protein